MFGVYIFINQYLQLVLGLSPLQAGITTLPWALTFVVGSLVTPRLSRRGSPVSLLVWGLVVSAAGFAMLTFVDGRRHCDSGGDTGDQSWAWPRVHNRQRDITAAPPERAGAASLSKPVRAEWRAWHRCAWRSSQSIVCAY
jgi:DHA2 family multidrug resistance protein-like MFS transporter